MRRGQLQTLEPIIIVMVLALIAGLSLLFYLRITEGQEMQQTREFRMQEDVATLGRIANLPELSCNRAETANTYCIDVYKARTFGEFLRTNHQARTYYYALFGATNITLQIISGGTTEQIALYENLNNTFVTQTRTYFTVQDPTTGSREFAVLIIEREQ